MPNKEDILTKARADIGVREIPDGSNRTTIGKWFGWNGVAWCAMSVSKWLITGGFKITKNAGAHELAAYLVSIGWKKISPANIVGGDVVLYTWSHIGICEARNTPGSIITIEGNTSNRCKRMSRANSSIDYGVRPPYSPDAVKPKPSDLPGGHHTAYVVYGNSKGVTGLLTNETGGTIRHPSPGVKGIVYPAPELGKPFRTEHGDLMVPIRWGGRNQQGNPNEGWYRYDYLRWGN